MYVIYFKKLSCYFIETVIDYEVYNLLRTFSYGILICFKCLIFVITCFTIKFIKKKIYFVSLDEF